MGKRYRITVSGVVQGVGFRPYVYRLAAGLGIKGYVLNTSGGVVVEAEGDGARAFSQTLTKNPPPLASIESISTEILPAAGYETFEIRLSESSPGEFAQVSPDIATCPDCLAELFEPLDRRYHHPFVNCTNCGPRYSIVTGIPYDRGFTTMKRFAMCEDCSAEYKKPSDRRFHAQPVACPRCGPGLRFIETGVAGTFVETAAGRVFEPVRRAAIALRAGQVVAVKGLGGFHLACNAADQKAARRLRELKRGSKKPFALMAPDIETIRRFCVVSEQEESLLSGRVRPIVILERKPEADGLISPDVAPGCRTLGFMLPYTPLHHLLMNGPGGAERNFDALVMTSGNISEEPIITDNREALDKLKGLCDSFLLHDRDIHMRIDDSVAKVAGGIPRVVRRARGYVPETIDMGREMPDILACGAELKNTLCMTKGRHAIVSQHIGDMTNFEATGFFAETLGNLMKIFGVNPSVVASDMHPDYLSTRFAYDYSLTSEPRPKLVAVQHHHAHVAACMAENGFNGKVIGIAFDGTGYGTDGKTWGSEFMVADFAGFERIAHLEYMPLPGGDAAVREPWRSALSVLVTAYGQKEGWEVFSSVKADLALSRGAEVVMKMLEKGVNCPPSSGMGRLFDAVSSLTGVLDTVSYEAEAAILLENEAYGAPDEDGAYPFALWDGSPSVIDIGPLVRAVVKDVKAGTPRAVISARFHNTITGMALKVCGLAREKTGIGTVALSGGVFQNALLSARMEEGLMDMGFRVLTHSKLPANDGCISLGQAAVAAAAGRPEA